ncbi:unknown protein [Microcystis aeruginosa NIES-843]|uniref:Uncharacterized protein n=1 Tax=Microcystis aeruginosa (strain NIES-843 / IAM M-2473) TaxID=449447 RepID=B0JKZ3_MICAN|nr:unknown protein [Microcystis aeruginosa NIES-843]
MFQSLIGFKINWNLFSHRRNCCSEGFQSLIGFKINWNAWHSGEISNISVVSIPNRV